MRTLAIDLGARRVGLALSDEGGKFATPFDVLQVTSPEQTVNLIVHVIEREGVERIVVGLPLNMDGTVGPMARQTVDWARGLSARAGKPVIFVDERLSSFDAEQRMNDRKRGGEKMTRGQKKKRLDAHAAAGFLQSFLDGQLQSIDIQ